MTERKYIVKNRLLKSTILLTVSSTILLSTACGNHNQDESSIDITSDTNGITSSESETTSAAEINSNNYIGYWHMENCAEIELTIDSVTSSVIVFSLWQYGTGTTGPISAELNKNTAVFQNEQISGSITLEDNYIKLCISSEKLQIPKDTEMLFDIRILESIQDKNNTVVSVTPADTSGVISQLPQTLYGQISSKGQTVSGMTSSYVCENGEFSTVRKQLGDKWHIRSDSSCYNYGILWYECYDSQDGDYYGWVNSEYLTFTDPDASSISDDLTYLGIGTVASPDTPLYIRSSKAYTEEGKIGQIPNNTNGFSVYDCGDANWYYINYNGTQGYASSKFIQVSAPTDNTPSYGTDLPTVNSGGASSSPGTSAVPATTAPAPNYKPEVKSQEIHGVTFNYVSDFHKYYEVTNETTDFNMDVTIKYCEPDDYLSPDSHTTAISNKTGTYDAEDIGNIYYSAGTDDFAIFEVTFSGTYSGAYAFYGSEGGIQYRKYTPYGTLLTNYRGDKQHMLIKTDNADGTMNQTVYIGFFMSEVGSVDFIMFDIAPDYES